MLKVGYISEMDFGIPELERLLVQLAQSQYNIENAGLAFQAYAGTETEWCTGLIRKIVPGICLAAIGEDKEIRLRRKQGS
ncbi:hypothetical protein D3C87_1413900 [compost metagenome]